jgi:sugar O-acyltransferase, sialic acid O-acetyltransferase NeuD family
MRLIMVGASGHGKICAEIAELSDRYEDILFLDDDSNVKRCGKYDVAGASHNFRKYVNDQTEFFVSIGNHIHRKRIQEEIENAGGVVAILIHPNATISRSVSLGAGSVVMPMVAINPDVKIGKGVIVNTSASVDHDCFIGDWCHVAVGAHLCGTVRLGCCCWVGAGAIINNSLNLCDDIIIGAGAIVVKNIEESGTYIGMPAKITHSS